MEFSSDTTPNGVAIITFDQHERLKALGPAGLRNLAVHLEALVTDDDVRTIVMTGSGKAFCSGASLDQLLGMMGSDGSDGLPDELMRELFDGAGLALAGDVVLASERASFHLTFVPKLSIVSDLGASWFLSRLAGRGRALAAMMTGEAISADEALNWGLVWRIEPHEVLVQAAIAMAERLADGPRHMFPLLRGTVDGASRTSLSDQLDLERDLNVRLCGTAQFTEGVRAFLERRPPCFQ